MYGLEGAARPLWLPLGVAPPDDDITINDIRKALQPRETGRDDRIGAIGEALAQATDADHQRDRIIAAHKKPRPVVAELEGSGWHASRPTDEWDLSHSRLTQGFSSERLNPQPQLSADKSR
jgi:hypothetical protein